MPLILYECASLRFRRRPPNWIPMIKVTFKFISALKQWLACTIFFATIPLHVRTHSSKNYSPISLHVFTLIFSITLSMSTPRMRNQSIQLTHQFLNSTLMIRLTFLKNFIPYSVFFLCNSKIFTTRTAGRDIQKGRRPRTADDPQEGPEALDDKEPTRVGECLQLIPPFLGSPGGEQPEPLPTVKPCKLVVSCKIWLHLFDQYLPWLPKQLNFPLSPVYVYQKDFQIVWHLGLLYTSRRVPSGGPRVHRPLLQFRQIIICVEVHKWGRVLPRGRRRRGHRRPTNQRRWLGRHGRGLRRRRLRIIRNLRNLHIQRIHLHSGQNHLDLLVRTLFEKFFRLFHSTTRNFWIFNYDPPAPIPTPCWNYSLIPFITPVLHLFNS